MAATRTIRVVLQAEIAQFRRDMTAAAGYVDRNAQHISSLSNSIGLLGAGMVAFAGVAIAKSSEFEKAMSAVEATGDDAANSIGALRDAALEAGASTVYSATESANAIEELAKAGLSSADILGGALDGALNLAAAGAMDVADAAETAATALVIFGLSGQDATHVSDLLAAGAGKAQGSVKDMGMALKQAGLVASQTGLSIEETTGGLAAFASAGLLGSDAGTSFKSMLQRLTPQSNEAKDAMDQLGIAAYDSQGNFIGLAEFAGNLQDALRDLTPEQRNSAMATIFGSDAVRAASVLYDQGEQGIREWIAAVDDQGFAAEVAATRLDNLAGDWEAFTGALDTAFINMGEGAQGPLRELTQAATSAVNAFTDLPKEVQQGTLALIGGGGLVLLGVAGLGKLVVAISDVKAAMAGLGVSARTAGIAVASIGGALAIATLALGAWSDANATAEQRVSSLRGSLDETTGEITKNTREVIANDLTARQGWWLFEKESAADSARGIGLSLDTLTDAILGNKDAISEVDAATDNTNKTWAETKAAAEAAGMSLSDYGAAQLTVRQEVEALTGKLAESKQQQGEVNDAVEEGTEATAQATQTLSAFDEAQQAATAALDEWRKTVADADGDFISLGGVYDTVIQKNKDYAQSTADATDSSSDSWEDYYDGVSLSAADYIAELQAQVDAQGAWEQNILDISARVRDGMSADMKVAAEQMIDELLELGPQGAAQVQLLHDMSDAEFAQVVDLWRQKGASAVEQFTSQVESYRQPVITLLADTTSAYNTVTSFIRDMNGRTITLNAQGQQLGFTGPRGTQNAMATGGFVSGPGTATSDSIHALLSNGEYVVRASAVEQYGRGFFDSLNAQRFATGGYVGGGGEVRAGADTSGRGVTVKQYITVSDPMGAAVAAQRRLTHLGV